MKWCYSCNNVIQPLGHPADTQLLVRGKIAGRLAILSAGTAGCADEVSEGGTPLVGQKREAMGGGRKANEKLFAGQQRRSHVPAVVCVSYTDHVTSPV
jgi:hypothetical protein